MIGKKIEINDIRAGEFRIDDVWRLTSKDVGLINRLLLSAQAGGGDVEMFLAPIGTSEHTRIELSNSPNLNNYGSILMEAENEYMRISSASTGSGVLRPILITLNDDPVITINTDETVEFADNIYVGGDWITFDHAVPWGIYYDNNWLYIQPYGAPMDYHLILRGSPDGSAYPQLFLGGYQTDLNSKATFTISQSTDQTDPVSIRLSSVGVAHTALIFDHVEDSTLNAFIQFGHDDRSALYFISKGYKNGGFYIEDNAILSIIEDTPGEEEVRDVFLYEATRIGTDNFVSQTEGWRIMYNGHADFRSIFADELRVTAFIAEATMALVGADFLTKSRSRLTRNFEVPEVGNPGYLYVESLEGFPGAAVFEDEDAVRLRVIDRSGGGLLVADVWGYVELLLVGPGTNPDDGDDEIAEGEQVYYFTRQTGGIADSGNIVYMGSVALDYGEEGDGLITRTVLDVSGSPYSRQMTWHLATDDNFNTINYSILTQVGNLESLAGLSGFGFYGGRTYLTDYLLIGDLAKNDAYLEYDANDQRLRMARGANVVLQVDDSSARLIQLYLDGENMWAGNASIGNANTKFVLNTGSSPKIALGTQANNITVANNNAGFIADDAGNFKAFGDSNNYIRKSGASLDVRLETFTIQSISSDLGIPYGQVLVRLQSGANSGLVNIIDSSEAYGTPSYLTFGRIIDDGVYVNRYGIAYFTGSSRLFELSANNQIISGWSIQSTQLSSTNISLFSGSDARLQVTGVGRFIAGLTRGSAATDVAFWIGDTYDNRAIAPVFIRFDGSGQLADGNIEWDVNGNVDIAGRVVSGNTVIYPIYNNSRTADHNLGSTVSAANTWNAGTSTWESKSSSVYTHGEGFKHINARGYLRTTVSDQQVQVRMRILEHNGITVVHESSPVSTDSIFGIWITFPVDITILTVGASYIVEMQFRRTGTSGEAQARAWNIYASSAFPNPFN